MEPKGCSQDMGSDACDVRYRYDVQREVRHKTVELIVESMPGRRARKPRREPNELVAVRIAYVETNGYIRIWMLRYAGICFHHSTNDNE